MPRLRGSKWQADAMVDGKRVRPTFATREEAEDFEANPKQDQVKPLVGPMFRHGFASHYLGTKNEPGAHLITEELIRRLGETTRVATITPARVQDLKTDLLRSGNAKQTVNKKMATLSVLLRFCMDRGAVASVPTIGYYPKENGRVRFLTETEVSLMLSPMPTEFQHFCQFLLYTGFRRGEALELEWQDVSEQAHGGRGVTTWRTKGNKPRTVPLVGPALDAVNWSRSQGHAKPWAWISKDNFRYAWNKSKLQAGLRDDPQVVPHILRHTCASRLVQAGVDIVRVKEWLRHATIEQTMQYAHLAPHSLFDVAHLLVPSSVTEVATGNGETPVPVSVTFGVPCATEAGLSH